MKNTSCIKAPHKQQGMAVLTMILLVVILLSVIGAVVATSRTSAASSADQTAKLLAAGIIDQGNSQKVGFDLLQAQANDIDTITYDSANVTGMFNPNTGGTIVQTPPADAISVAGTGWAYAKGGTTAKGVKLTGVGTGGSSYAILLPNVKDSVCKQINAALRGYAPQGGIPVAAAAPTITNGTNGNNLVSAEWDLTTLTFSTVWDPATLAPFATAPTQINGYSVCVATGTGASAVNKNVYVNIVKGV